LWQLPGLLVQQQYQEFLRRGTDAGGLKYWVGYLNSGGVIEDLKAQILGSQEYYDDAGDTNLGYLQRLYRDLFGRDIEAAGQQYWLGRLSTDLTRTGLAKVFATIKETENTLVAGFFQIYLHRAADQSSIDYFSGQLQTGALRDEDIVRLLVASDEYFSHV
jgi:hypothetical protein